MRHARYRLFWAWNFDKEEAWLNEQAAHGLALVDAAGIRYVFEECEPGAYEYRLELLENMACAAEGRRYLDFLEEMGIECVGMFGRWAYLRRRCDDAPFDLFSDIDSKIKHLRRIDALLFAALALQLAGLAALFHMREYPQDMLPFVFVWLAFVVLVGFGFVRIARKAGRLKRERAVRE